MDYETVSAGDFGRSLSGLGLNLLVRDVAAEAGFLSSVFEMSAHRQSRDFAIMSYHGEVFQLHADGTFGSHPLLSLLPESGRAAQGSRSGCTRPTRTRLRQGPGRSRMHWCCRRRRTSRMACANA